MPTVGHAVAFFGVNGNEDEEDELSLCLCCFLVFAHVWWVGEVE